MGDELLKPGGNDWVALPTSTVWLSRLIWFVLVAGQIGFAVVAGVVVANGGGPGRRLPTTLVLAIDAVILAVGLVLAIITRRRGVAGSDAPGAIRRAAIRVVLVPMAVLEAASLFGITVALVTGEPWPVAVVPAVSLLIQLWLFPKRTVRRRA